MHAFPLAYLKNHHVQTSRNFLFTLLVAMTLLSSDVSVTRYVFPLL